MFRAGWGRGLAWARRDQTVPVDLGTEVPFLGT